MLEETTYNVSIFVEYFEIKYLNRFSIYVGKKQLEKCRMANKIQCLIENSPFSKFVQNPGLLETYMKMQLTYNLTKLVSEWKKLARVSSFFRRKDFKKSRTTSETYCTMKKNPPFGLCKFRTNWSPIRGNKLPII